MAAWKDKLKSQLKQTFKGKKGEQLFKRYSNAFPDDYIDDYEPDMAVADIALLERLSQHKPFEIDYYGQEQDDSSLFHVRLYQWNKLIALSDMLPLLENFGLRTESERPYQISPENAVTSWVCDFVVNLTHPTSIRDVSDLFEDAFKKVFYGDVENDGFNNLVLAAGLSWKQISLLRMYAKYLRQVGFQFSQPYIQQALINQAPIAKALVNLFELMHCPKTNKNRHKQIKEAKKNIIVALESVESLDEDKIIRKLLELIKNTLRTNYFQTTNNGDKNYISIKIDSRSLSNMPLPIPMYEIFVYSPRFEGIHLRHGKIARGGLRWSDRPEDFRTEVLGLMKAQVVKNSVIVPTGAKGGFVIKTSMPQGTREEIQKEVIACYKLFISGLLDLTDNIKEGNIVPPADVVCYDEPDPYLVVAADKGTASFSDIANDISCQYGFWLGDAFASGGSTGYDHKAMGITARGAWESIKRHFRELSIDPLKTDITVIGIGDMSGDVFGNGMLYSKHIKLIGAFDHRHIFLDPDPDPAASFKERERLFNLPTSSWEDYNPKLISKGGGVFSRKKKSIKLSPQIKKALSTTENELTPSELIRIMLKAPVDLIYNGGIGTYVKASTETHADAGDRTNEYCRINGDELRCKVVGEGGNLGFTQRARIEYALNGGLINTDFIDNSAGVDCSDHEVNLKILLNQALKSGKLSEKKRNDLLASKTDEVAELVLRDNYYQALVMSFSAYHSAKNISLHMRYLNDLESQHILDRKVEHLPSTKEIAERKAAEQGLTRPELAVLLAYSKIAIKHEIIDSELIDDPYLRRLLSSAFPASIRKQYQALMEDHRLAREIIATQLSNRIVNDMGITFVYRLQVETGATTSEVIRAYIVAFAIFNKAELQELILSLDFKVSMADQYNMLYNVRNLINLATRWFLHGRHLHSDLEKIIKHFSPRVQKLEQMTPTLMSGITSSYMTSLVNEFTAAGLPRDIALRIATYRAIYTSLNIIDVSTNHNLDLEKTAQVYFRGGERINLVWYRDQINTDSREGHWNVMARLALRDELDISQRALTIAIMKGADKNADADELINTWVENNGRALERWNRVTNMLTSSSNVEYTMFFIAIRELVGLIAASTSSRTF